MEADKVELFKARVFWRAAKVAGFLRLERVKDYLLNKSGKHLCRAFWMIEDCE